jgi:hypothetical protein
MEVYCHPDIATLSNRINLSPWWVLKFKGRELEDIVKHPGDRTTLLNHIYYRVGRSMLKKDGINIPKLEKVNYKSKNWYETIEHCKANIDTLPTDHSLAVLQNRIGKGKLEDILPDLRDVAILEELYKGFRKTAEYLNQSEENRFPSNFGVKFSILEYKDRERIPICWDLIKGL